MALLSVDTRQLSSESARLAMPLALRFARWGAVLGPEAIPLAVRHAADRAILDTLGVMAAGSAHPKVGALAASLAGASGNCLTATGHQLDATAAATVNGMAAHVWDYDDNSYTGMIHGSAIILPAVLAAAHEAGATDQAIRHAFIIGSEIAYTLGEVVAHEHFLRGWWATGSLALIGAVAGVCRLFNLGADETAQAIGTAAVTAGIERAIAGTDTKSYLCGHVAAQAISLAKAARAGLTGPVDAFEHPNGFFALLNGGKADPTEADTLGQRWRLETPGLLFKTSPVCSAAHAIIEVTADLLARADKTAADIKTAKADVPQLVRASLIFDTPQSAQEAQFSLPYCLACAALHGCVRLEDLEPDAIFAPEKVALASRVTVDVAEDLSQPPKSIDFPESTRLTLTFGDGSSIEGFCGEASGMPNRPLSDTELRAKYETCLAYAGRPAASLPSSGSLTDLVNQSFGLKAQ